MLVYTVEPPYYGHHWYQIFVLINEVSLFQGENIMYLYEVGTGLSVLINQSIFNSECPLRNVPLYTKIK